MYKTIGVHPDLTYPYKYGRKIEFQGAGGMDSGPYVRVRWASLELSGFFLYVFVMCLGIVAAPTSPGPPLPLTQSHTGLGYATLRDGPPLHLSFAGRLQRHLFR